MSKGKEMESQAIMPHSVSNEISNSTWLYEGKKVKKTVKKTL